MTDVDRQVARASEFLDRSRERAAELAARRRKAQGLALSARLTRIAAVDGTILLAATVIGWFVPLGIGGAMLVMAALIAATVGLAIFPATSEVKAEALPQTPLKLLPMKTEQWLDRQRSTLPPAAQSLADGIGMRLAVLAPQMALLDEGSPEAFEVRKLIGEQLPALINEFTQVPPPLRSVERNGKTPNQQLAEGLALIDDQIAALSAALAEGALDNLATRGRFLEIKYKDDGTEA